MGDTGPEQIAVSGSTGSVLRNSTIPSAAKSGAVTSDASSVLSPALSRQQLADFVAAWPLLTPHDRVSIVRMVNSAICNASQIAADSTDSRGGG
ncbi:MAG: hypothetical protein JWN70_3415 [Planctomycetaceae bacterium]|nr:hypothetical protein [Planctomycetaceae bacterium]